MHSLVSICIPAWERPQLLLETIHSCLAQTYPEIEVVVCDDSRSDAVEEAIASLGHLPSLRYSRYKVRARLGRMSGQTQG